MTNTGFSCYKTSLNAGTRDFCQCLSITTSITTYYSYPLQTQDTMLGMFEGKCGIPAATLIQVTERTNTYEISEAEEHTKNVL